MASIADEQEIFTNEQTVETNQREARESREGSVEKRAAAAAIKDRDEKLKLAKERQNEERQRKIEELRAQAEAAQRYREQKEEERRRRIEETRIRDNEKRHQVEERKRAIMEAEKERREYILRKNQERESRLEAKRRERSSIAFAFGSSTPRLLEPADFGMVSSSTFWGQRRSTSISNVAGVSPLSRRSSERELNDSGTKKRATSASGSDRRDEDNVDATTSSSHIVFRSVARRKTDLMPTIPTPRDGHHYGSRSSLSTTPRTPGRAYSMNRLDQLAKPIRRNGEHICAILERERRERMDLMDETESLGGTSSGGVYKRRFRKNHGDDIGHHFAGGSGGKSATSRSMSHLAGTLAATNSSANTTNTHHTQLHNSKYSVGGGISSSFRPLNNNTKDNCKSLTYLYSHSPKSQSLVQAQAQAGGLLSTTTQRSNLGLQTAATKKYLQSSLASSASTKRGQQHFTNPYRYDPNSLLLMSSSFSITAAGSRSGNVTPGGNSRPGSAMSTSTTLSTTVTRRSVPVRHPRPASIAGTGVSLDEMNKQRKESKPPLKTSSAHAHLTTSAQTTSKRSNNLMSTSLIVTSSSSSLSNTPIDKRANSSVKRDQRVSLTPKALSKTSSSDRLNKLNKSPKEAASGSPSQLTSMTKSAIVTTAATIAANQKPTKVKPEKKPTAAGNIETEQPSSLKAPNAEAIATAPITVDLSTTKSLTPEATESITITETVIENTEIVKDKEREQNKKDVEQIEKAEKVENGVFGVTENTEMASESGNNLSIIQNDSINGNDIMTASMIARSKITTEEEAKAALAEKRRLMREEAERQAELERQRIEAERLAEMRRQEEEAERQRKFEEESLRLAEEQRNAEQQRLRQAIEEAKQREEEERRKRDDEDRQRSEREEAEKKAKEEAEKQRLEVAERLKREEKEREERRKRVEAIMSRTRKGGAGTNSNTPISTPSKDSNATNVDNAQTQPEQKQQQQQQQQQTLPTSTPSSIESSSPTASSTTSATTPPQQQEQLQQPEEQQQLHQQLQPHSSNVASTENTQAVYEQSVMDKENALINSFTNMIIDENAKNLLQQHQHLNQIEVTNGKLLANFPNSDAILQNLTTTASVVANGNGHIENINNKNDINILQDVLAPTTVATTNQLIDLNMESQDINNVHFNNNNNNNNSLLASTATTANTLVNADSHENADISLL